MSIRIFASGALLIFIISAISLGHPSCAKTTPPAPVLSNMQSSPSEQSALLLFATNTLLEKLHYGPKPTPPTIATGPSRACFVTFFVGRKVVACFGSFQPRTTTLADEIAENIDLALRHDPRAAKLNRHLARQADVQITFPDQPEPISSYRQVDPAREGLFVENDRQGVAIVPGEAKTSAWAYRSAMQRLGESDASGVRIYRFSASAISSRSFGRSIPGKP